MLLPYSVRAAILAISLAGAIASPTAAGTDVTISSWGMNAVRRSLSEYRHQKRATEIKNGTTLEKRWDGATLLSLEHSRESSGNRTQSGAGNNTASGDKTLELSGGVEVVCTTCYVQTNFTAQLTFNGSFNITRDIAQIRGAVNNVTNATINYVQNYTSGVSTNLNNGFDLDDFNLPPLDVDFNIPTPEVPGAFFTFLFDGMEFYIALNTIFSAGVTYTINLITAPTPIGIPINKDFFIGVVPSIDLILSTDTEINMSSGFHIKFDDGVALEVGLFGNNVTQTRLTGGNFEFLPVTVESVGVTLKAIIRVKVRAGYEISTPPVLILGQDITDVLNLKASSGIEVSVWADIAELATSVTVFPAGDENGCKLRVEEWYQCAVGAAAGATVALAGHVWGPTPETSIPIWGTTLTQCAIEASSTSSSSADGSGLTTTTLSKNVTYRAIECLSTGLVDCPVSLQSTTKVVTNTTLVTAVPSGVRATFPTTTESTVGETIAFGTGAQALFATSGPPTAFTPTPSAGGSGSTGGGSGDSGSNDNKNRKIILGVCIGLGVPILLVIIALIILWLRRKGQNSDAEPSGAAAKESDAPEKPAPTTTTAAE
ncbi:hypothetical protein ABW20_dc0106242 [Dactylellina cionopaga]|nr:hypothetical protein ABW20_dc0106242 [Dactylellina cionopaga]